MEMVIKVRPMPMAPTTLIYVSFQMIIQMAVELTHWFSSAHAIQVEGREEISHGKGKIDAPASNQSGIS